MSDNCYLNIDHDPVVHSIDQDVSSS